MNESGKSSRRYNIDIRRVLLVANLAKKDAKEIAKDVATYLEAKDVAVETFLFEGKPDRSPNVDFDLVFSLGGDGTVLYTARLLANTEVPIMAVNIGDFGFITEIGRDEWAEAYEKYVSGILGLSRRIMLRATVIRNGEEIVTYRGLNDAFITSTGISKIVRMKVDINGTRLGGYRADGVIVSTPTGSTAHSAAAGGPILDPEMEAVIMIPICPFTLSNRPLVLQGNQPVYVDIERNQRTQVILTIDGQDMFELEEGDKICFRVSEHRAMIVRSDKRNFFEVLRTKLNWSGGPDA